MATTTALSFVLLGQNELRMQHDVFSCLSLCHDSLVQYMLGTLLGTSWDHGGPATNGKTNRKMFAWICLLYLGTKTQHQSQKEKSLEADTLDVTELYCIFPPAQTQMVCQHHSSSLLVSVTLLCISMRVFVHLVRTHPQLFIHIFRNLSSFLNMDSFVFVHMYLLVYIYININPICA